MPRPSSNQFAASGFTVATRRTRTPDAEACANGSLVTCALGSRAKGAEYYAAKPHVRAWGRTG